MIFPKMIFHLLLVFIWPTACSIYEDLFHSPTSTLDSELLQLDQVKVNKIVDWKETFEVSGRICRLYRPLNYSIVKESTEMKLGKVESAILDVINSLSCLPHNTLGWHYKFCPLQTTQKFNMKDELLNEDFTDEEVKYLGTVEFSLGAKLNDSRMQTEGKITLMQELVGGTYCEEAFTERSTLVYYSCGKTYQVVDIIEYSVCKYSVHISLPIICEYDRIISDNKEIPETFVECVDSNGIRINWDNVFGY
jgi:hypothetical protein